jgi:glycosyltransferase involved in cell wall biosynthesis
LLGWDDVVLPSRDTKDYEVKVLKLKIALDCRLVNEKITGISRFSLKFTDFFIERFGVENIILIVNDNIDHYQHVEQYKTHLKPFNFYHWLCFPRLLKSLKLSHYFSFHYSGLSSKLSAIKTAVTVHDLMYELVPTFFGSKWISVLGRAYYRQIVKSSLKNSDLVLTISETSKLDIKQLFNMDSKNVSEGVFLDVNEKDGFCQQLLLQPKSYFLYAGNGRPHKNISQLKRVFSEYRKLNGNVFLVIVGHSGNKQDGVVYPGYITDGELVSLYKNAKSFVFPSLYEGFGLPIVEALSFSCPIIASNIPAFKEFEHNNIQYFNLSDDESLLLALKSESVFDKDSAKLVLDRYSWSVIKNKLYRAIEELF